MKYISFGIVNKKLLYILIGGIGKLTASTILFLFKEDIKTNKHSFILGINSGLGMMLAFIPDIILKYKSKKKNTSIIQEKLLLVNDTSSEASKKETTFFTKTKLKIIIILACSILDYIQKM